MTIINMPPSTVQHGVEEHLSMFHPHVTIERPLQAYFRIDTKNMGQFERTLIIVDEDSHVHYMEGCTATYHTTGSLHAAVVEVFVKKRMPVAVSLPFKTGLTTFITL